MRLVWIIIPIVLIGVVGVQESFSESNNTKKQPKLVLEIDKQFPVIGDEIKFTITNKGPKDAIFNFELYDSDGLIVPLHCFDNPNTKDLLPSDFSRSVTWNQKNCKDFLKSGTFLFNSYLTIDNKLTGFVSALEFEVYNEKQPQIEIPTEIPQIPAKEILPIDEIPINFGDRGDDDNGLIPNKNSNPYWEITDFYMSNNGNFEISLVLDDAGHIPTETFHTCVSCRESITIPLNDLNYVDSVVFLEGFSEYSKKYFYGEYYLNSYKIPFTDILALNPINSQIHYAGNYNTTLAFDTLRDPADFSKFEWIIHWVRAYEGSDGAIYYQLSKFSINPTLDERFISQGTLPSKIVFPDYAATKSYPPDSVNFHFIDNWMKQNVLNTSHDKGNTNNAGTNKTGTFTVTTSQKIFNVGYSITNGNDVLDIRSITESLVILLKSYNDGVITLSMPLEFTNPTYCVDNSNYEIFPNYFAQREPLEHVILSKPKAETVVIEFPFLKYMDELAIVFDTNYKPDEKPSCPVMDNVAILPPLKQISNQIESQDVLCSKGLDLVFKTEDSSPACVKPGNKSQLIERDWAMPNYVSPLFVKYELKLDDDNSEIIKYSMVPSLNRITEVTKNPDGSMSFFIRTISSGTFNVDIRDHHHLPQLRNGMPWGTFVLIDGKESEHDIIMRGSTAVFTIPFKSGIHEITVYPNLK